MLHTYIGLSLFIGKFLLHQTGSSHALYEAVLEKRIADAEQLLEEGANPNQKWLDGTTGLHTTAQYGYLDIGQLLVGRGCNVNLPDNYGLTPLHYAAKTNHKDIAEFLLSSGADSNLVDKNGWTPLHYASCYGYDNLAASLATEINVKMPSNDGKTAFHLACFNNHLETVKVLSKNSADVNASTADGSTGLCLACKSGSLDCVSLLIALGGDVNKTNDSGMSPLHEACLGNHVDIVEELLKYEAIPDAVSVDGILPCSLGNCLQCKQLVHQAMFVNKQEKGTDSRFQVKMICPTF